MSAREEREKERETERKAYKISYLMYNSDLIYCGCVGLYYCGGILNEGFRCLGIGLAKDSQQGFVCSRANWFHTQYSFGQLVARQIHHLEVKF